MWLEKSYAFFEGVIPERICDAIIKTGLEKNCFEATIGLNSDLDNLISKENKTQKDYEEIENLKQKISSIRKSNISWIEDTWVANWIEPYVKKANSMCNWNYDYDIRESFQFTQYRGDYKGHYDWHQDSKNVYTEKTHKNPNFYGKYRKLSAVVILSSKADYEGGDFLISEPFSPENPPKIYRVDAFDKKGSVLVFPSHLFHKVAPVTWGLRYSLVSWFCGRTFK